MVLEIKSDSSQTSAIPVFSFFRQVIHVYHVPGTMLGPEDRAIKNPHVSPSRFYEAHSPLLPFTLQKWSPPTFASLAVSLFSSC